MQQGRNALSQRLLGVQEQYLPQLTQEEYANQAALNAQNAHYISQLMPLQRQVEAANLGNAQAQAGIQNRLLGLTGQYMPGVVQDQYKLAGANAKMLLQEQPLLEQLRRSQMGREQGDLYDYEASRGLEQKFMQESEDGLDPRLAMNRAGAGVEHAMAGAGQAIDRDIARRGVNQSSGQSMNAQRQNLISKALGVSAARTKAWNETDDTNYARLGNAVNARKGLAPAGMAGASGMMPNNTGFGLGTPSSGMSQPQGVNSALLSLAGGGAGGSGGFNVGGGYTPVMRAPGSVSQSTPSFGDWDALADAAGKNAAGSMGASGYLFGRAFG